MPLSKTVWRVYVIKASLASWKGRSHEEYSQLDISRSHQLGLDDPRDQEAVGSHQRGVPRFLRCEWSRVIVRDGGGVVNDEVGGSDIEPEGDYAQKSASVKS